MQSPFLSQNESVLCFCFLILDLGQSQSKKRKIRLGAKQNRIFYPNSEVEAFSCVFNYHKAFDLIFLKCEFVPKARSNIRQCVLSSEKMSPSGSSGKSSSLPRFFNTIVSNTLPRVCSAADIMLWQVARGLARFAWTVSNVYLTTVWRLELERRACTVGMLTIFRRFTSSTIFTRIRNTLVFY